jgi:hypothetical protein
MGSFKHKGGLGPKSLHGNMFYKGHRGITETASHHLKKASILLKMHFKSPTVLEKATISLKKSSKTLVGFIQSS